MVPHKTIITRKMYFDEYVKSYGDGFYPQLFLPDEGYFISTDIEFRLEDESGSGSYVWIQSNNSAIYGFDGIYGIQLLVSLNNEARVNATKILNIAGRIIYPRTENSTYRILDQS